MTLCISFLKFIVELVTLPISHLQSQSHHYHFQIHHPKQKIPLLLLLFQLGSIRCSVSLAKLVLPQLKPMFFEEKKRILMTQKIAKIVAISDKI